MIGAGSVKVGLKIGENILAHVNFQDSLEKSRHSNPDPTRVPSPDMTLISSKLEIGELNSPLESLLHSQFELSLLLILVITIISFLMIYLFINNKSKDKLSNIRENKNSSISFSKSTSSESKNHTNLQVKENSSPHKHCDNWFFIYKYGRLWATIKNQVKGLSFGW